MDIYQLISEHKKGNHAFSVKYTHSIKKNGQFHIDVDNEIGHLYEYYGGKKFTKIFNDIITPRIDYFKFSIDDMLLLYKNNYKKFANLYKSSKLANSKRDSEFADAVDGLLSSYYKENIGINFSKIFYDIENPKAAQSICKFCNENYVMFKNNEHTYSEYCSAKCAQKDVTRVSESARQIGTHKRNEKMKALLNDPIKRKEYCEKIRKSGIAYRETDAGKQMIISSSIRMKYQIKSGEFTPCITNSWNRWNASALGKKFRSRFEAIFYVYCYENNIPVEYEKLRIQYFHPIQNKIRNYIVDFVDNVNKVIYEIKPKSLIKDIEVSAKETAAIEWCEKNEYSFKFITEDDLKKYIQKNNQKQRVNNNISRGI